MCKSDQYVAEMARNLNLKVITRFLTSRSIIISFFYSQYCHPLYTVGCLHRKFSDGISGTNQNSSNWSDSLCGRIYLDSFGTKPPNDFLRSSLGGTSNSFSNIPSNCLHNRGCEARIKRCLDVLRSHFGFLWNASCIPNGCFCFVETRRLVQHHFRSLSSFSHSTYRPWISRLARVERQIRGSEKKPRMVRKNTCLHFRIRISRQNYHATFKPNLYFLSAKFKFKDIISLFYTYFLWRFYKLEEPGKVTAGLEAQFTTIMKENEIRLSDQRRSKHGGFSTKLRAFLKPTGWKPMFILFMFFLFQQFSGIYITLFYAVNWFDVSWKLKTNFFFDN